jgi:hypothetical protein
MEISAKGKLISNYLEENFIHYVTNCLDSEIICKEIGKILEQELSDNVTEQIYYLMWYYGDKWENYPSDSEGATPYQEKEMDKIIDSCIQEILLTISLEDNLFHINIKN